MDTIKLLKVHSTKKSKKHQQLLDNFFLYSMTVLTCTVFCSIPFWVPYLFSSMEIFLHVYLPKITSILLSSKFIFLFGNLIIIVLVGESKFFAANSPPASDVYYDEYMTQKKSLQTSSTIDEKKERQMEKPSKENCTKICEDGGILEGKGGGQGELELAVEKGGHDEVDGDDDQLGLPTEELNKRADDFIARVNRQRMLEARLLCYCR